MAHSTRVQRASNDSLLFEAISSFLAGEFTSIRVCAASKGVPYTTLYYRLSGRTSRSNAMENRQNLSSAEEETLLRWITRLTCTGYPASPALVLEMAEEIR